MLYTVTWEIQIDADSPEQAAREAFAIQRAPESIATCFEVQVGDQVEHFDFRQEETYA